MLGLGVSAWETVLMLGTVSQAASTVALLVIVLLFAMVLELFWQWRAAHRRLQMVRTYNRAKSSYSRGQAGLRTMADVFTRLPGNSRNLSRQGVALLDAYAAAATSFKRLMHDLRTMSRDRALRHLTRELHRLQDCETTFQDFQKDVLRMVAVQAASGTLTPPIPVRHYRAAFTVLRHELQQDLWPVMNGVLAAGVQLKMLDAEQRWRVVPVVFTNGSQAVFSRKWLERALALQLVIHQPGHPPKVFEFTVEHEQPIRGRVFSFSAIRSHLAGRPV